MSGGRGRQRLSRGGTLRPQLRRPPVQHEKVQQAQILQLAALVCVRLDDGRPAYWVLGTRRSRGKPCPSCGTFVAEHQGLRQTPGHPDLVLFLKGRGESGPRLLYWETKAGRNTTSDDQDAFLGVAAAAGANTGVGDYDAFAGYLVREGYLKAESFPHSRQPEARS
jgi:ribosomal protein S27AE